MPVENISVRDDYPTSWDLEGISDRRDVVILLIIMCGCQYLVKTTAGAVPFIHCGTVSLVYHSQIILNAERNMVHLKQFRQPVSYWVLYLH